MSGISIRDAEIRSRLPCRIASHRSLTRPFWACPRTSVALGSCSDELALLPRWTRLPQGAPRRPRNRLAARSRGPWDDARCVLKRFHRYFRSDWVLTCRLPEARCCPNSERLTEAMIAITGVEAKAVPVRP